MALGSRIIFFFWICIVINGCYTVSNADLDCALENEVSSSISFYNIDSSFLKDLKLIKVCAIDTEITYLTIGRFDTLSRYEAYIDSFFEDIRVSVDQTITLNKKCDYYLYLNRHVIKIKPESFDKYYQNTMLSEDCYCDLDWYSIDSISKNGRYIEISRADLITLKKI